MTNQESVNLLNVNKIEPILAIPQPQDQHLKIDLGGENDSFSQIDDTTQKLADIIEEETSTTKIKRKNKMAWTSAIIAHGKYNEEEIKSLKNQSILIEEKIQKSTHQENSSTQPDFIDTAGDIMSTIPDTTTVPDFEENN